MLHYPIIIKITAKNEAITELFTLSLQICKSGYLCADFQLEAETETETKIEPETRAALVQRAKHFLDCPVSQRRVKSCTPGELGVKAALVCDRCDFQSAKTIPAVHQLAESLLQRHGIIGPGLSGLYNKSLLLLPRPRLI